MRGCLPRLVGGVGKIWPVRDSAEVGAVETLADLDFPELLKAALFLLDPVVLEELAGSVIGLGVRSVSTD